MTDLHLLKGWNRRKWIYCLRVKEIPHLTVGQTFVTSRNQTFTLLLLLEAIATYFRDEYFTPSISVLKTRQHVINRHSENISKQLLKIKRFMHTHTLTHSYKHSAVWGHFTWEQEIL